MEGFYLMGHSFGGYVAGHYTHKYPENVKKVILMSPLGTKVTDCSYLDKPELELDTYKK